LTVTTEGKSLKKGITEAEKIIKDIEQIAKKYCLEHSKAKKDCEDIFEATKYEIEPKYHLVRKVETFTRKKFYS
jgi:F0F1-type ATP synthase membrane subunit b/b'